MAVPIPPTIARTLYAAADARAKQLGLRFGDGAGLRLRRRAKDAARRIWKGAKGKKKEFAEAYVRGAVRVGSEAMVVFVDEMAVARLQIEGYVDKYPNTIGEQTEDRAKSALCPIWPIC
jgi:hypothetical protein